MSDALRVRIIGCAQKSIWACYSGGCDQDEEGHVYIIIV